MAPSRDFTGVGTSRFMFHGVMPMDFSRFNRWENIDKLLFTSGRT